MTPMTRFPDTETDVEYARLLWAEGAERIERHSEDSRRRRVLDDIVDAIVDQLERRIGQTFTSIELVRASRGADDWCREIAEHVAPEDPWAWSSDSVLGAAFLRYLRRAMDYDA